MKELSPYVLGHFASAILQAEEYRKVPDVEECSDLNSLYERLTYSRSWDAGVMFYLQYEGKDVYLLNQIMGSEFALIVDDIKLDSLSVDLMTFEEFESNLLDYLWATPAEISAYATRGVYKRRQEELAGGMPYTERFIGFKGVPLDFDQELLVTVLARLRSCYAVSYAGFSLQAIVDSVLDNSIELKIDSALSELIAYRISDSKVPDDIVTAVLRVIHVTGYNMLRSQCDFMYHCNVLANGLGRGDGCSNFY